ncbi:MAG: hypothetical protein JXA97_06015 [Anaerolineales bacterium]|nr:hypothetical protein [Anaerolineales bacterium]
MRVIERSEFCDEEGNISLEDRLEGTLQSGFSWYGAMQAQHDVTRRIQNTLGVEHTLIRNAVIPGTTLTIPMILLSPQGVRVLIPSPARGIFRAKSEEWLRFDSRNRRFKRAKPNLQMQALMMSQSLHKYFQDQGYPLPEIEAVLLFTNPRTHVDTARPRIRILLADAIEHFASNLQQFQPIMDQEDILALIDALDHPRVEEPELIPEAVREEDSGQEEVDLLRGPTSTTDIFIREPAIVRPSISKPTIFSRMNLKRKQWILLAVMTFFEIVVLIVLVMLVLANTLFA